MPDRRHPSAAFWATVVVVAALVAYPLAWGPWMALDAALDLPALISSSGQKAFAPIVHLQKRRLMPWPYQHYVEFWLKAKRWGDRQKIMQMEREATVQGRGPRPSSSCRPPPPMAQ